MQLALSDFGWAAAWPDRLADAANGLTVGGVLGDELAPGGDDLRGVAAQHGYVHKARLIGAGTRGGSQELDVGSDDSYRKLVVPLPGPGG